MKDTLKPGIQYQCKFTVTDNQTVPAMYPESGEAMVSPKSLPQAF